MYLIPLQQSTPAHPSVSIAANMTDLQYVLQLKNYLDYKGIRNFVGYSAGLVLGILEPSTNLPAVLDGFKREFGVDVILDEKRVATFRVDVPKHHIEWKGDAGWEMLKREFSTTSIVRKAVDSEYAKGFLNAKDVLLTCDYVIRPYLLQNEKYDKPLHPVIRGERVEGILYVRRGSSRVALPIEGDQ